MHKKRLLNAARALRESPNPEKFTMRRYINECGSPACVLGHYAARKDLQRTFGVDTVARVLYRRNPKEIVGYYSLLVQSHFGISPWEAETLFNTSGCNGAITSDEAATYIENFVNDR